MAKNAATESELGALHRAIAVGLTEVITQGEQLTDSEGAVVKKTASAAYFAAGIALLKNNNITSSAEDNAALTGLAAALAAKRSAAKQGMKSGKDLDAATADYLAAAGGSLQ